MAISIPTDMIYVALHGWFITIDDIPASSTISAPDGERRFTFPWEGFVAGTPGALVPIWFPDNFEEMRYIAWNEEPLTYRDKKEVMSEDSTYRAHGGKPQSYWRDDDLENVFYIYPLPSSPVWDDQVDEGQALFREDDTVNQETGVVVDRSGGLTTQGTGIATDLLDAADNIFMIYKAAPQDIEDVTDESDFPAYLRKYIEYGVLERAYSANTDGKIESLRDYWAYRKQVGLKLIEKFKGKKTVDRDFRLTTPRTFGRRTRKQPPLPDGY